MNEKKMRERPKRASAPEKSGFPRILIIFPYISLNFLDFLKLLAFLEISFKSQNFPKYEEIFIYKWKPRCNVRLHYIGVAGQGGGVEPYPLSA